MTTIPLLLSSRPRALPLPPARMHALAPLAGAPCMHACCAGSTRWRPLLCMRAALAPLAGAACMHACIAVRCCAVPSVLLLALHACKALCLSSCFFSTLFFSFSFTLFFSFSFSHTPVHKKGILCLLQCPTTPKLNYKYIIITTLKSIYLDLLYKA